MQYHEALSTTSTPGTSAYTVTYNGVDQPISSVTVSGTDVTITLTTEVTGFTGAYAVTYAPPGYV